jgi:hypothetical protein
MTSNFIPNELDGILEIVKSPDETLDYNLDWSDYLTNNPGLIVTSFNTKVSGSCTVLGSTKVGSVTTVILGGGLLGDTCEVATEIHLSDSTVVSRLFRVKLRKR